MEVAGDFVRYGDSAARESEDHGVFDSGSFAKGLREGASGVATISKDHTEPRRAKQRFTAMAIVGTRDAALQDVF